MTVVVNLHESHGQGPNSGDEFLHQEWAKMAPETWWRLAIDVDVDVIDHWDLTVTLARRKCSWWLDMIIDMDRYGDLT